MPIAVTSALVQRPRRLRILLCGATSVILVAIAVAVGPALAEAQSNEPAARAVAEEPRAAQSSQQPDADESADPSVVPVVSRAQAAASPPAALSSDTTPPPAADPMNTQLRVRAKRLSLWLAELSTAGKRSRLFSTGTSFAAATTLGFIGGALVSRLGRDDKGVNGVGSLFSGLVLGTSAGYLYGAVANIAFISAAEERYRRWQAVQTPDELTVARFESELAAEAQVARRTRFIQAGGSLGIASVGIATVALTATQNLTDSGRTGLYIYGTVMLALGIAGVVDTSPSRVAASARLACIAQVRRPKPLQRPS